MASRRSDSDPAVALTGMGRYRDREVDTLSGGERQRAWIALALAQRTGLLLLDEPTTYLASVTSSRCSSWWRPFEPSAG